MDDLLLIEHVQAREQDAMLKLHARYVDLVYSIVYRVLNEPTVAEEATQDAFMKVWQNAHSFDPARGPLVAWLARIARNSAIDHLRLRTRQSGRDESLEAADEARALPLPDDWQDRERVQGLKMALDALPPEQAQVITLSYYGGMSQSDISEQLGLPLGTVKTRMRIGMQKLKDAWINA